MKKINKKSLVLLVCVTVLLTFTVSGTVAFLADNSGPVTNVFTPTKVDITVTDEVENGVKKDVVIGNTSTIPVYIRVAVVANWYKDGNIVAPWLEDANFSAMLAENWVKRSDGYYYYTQAVQPSQTSIQFFKPSAESNPAGYDPGTPPIDGAHLEMTIIAQAIQTEPVQVLTDAKWGWTPTITQ